MDNNMNPDTSNITTADEARQYAIEWQASQSKGNISYSELAEWQAIFETLADKFDLTEEFKENGII